MNIIWGLVLIIFTFGIGWLGQLLNVLFPAWAERVGLNESREDVDPAVWADTRGEALWDVFSLWTLPAAGLLLVLDHPAWAYFGLVGGGMYCYFSGRAILVRRAMQRHGIRIGPPGFVKAVYAFMILAGSIGLITILIAIAALS